MQQSQLAINSVSTKHKDLEEALSAYAAAGFRNVEFVLPLVKDWMAQGHTVADVRALLESKGLKSVGGFQTHVQCFGDAEAQKANHAIHLENAKLIHDLGGGTIVVGTDGPPTPSIDALDVVGDTLAKLADQIEAAGIQDVSLAVEFNWSPLVKSLQSAVHVAERANHPKVGILFDPAHYYCTVTKFEDINARSVPLIKHVHVDDMRDKPGELSNCNSDRVLPGQGVIDLKAMFGELEKHGYKGYYSIELFNEDLWKLPAAETAKQSYQSLLPYCK